MARILFFCLFLSGINLTAQKFDATQFRNLKIRNVGPANMSGRITAIDVLTNNPNVMYIGAASGGVWKSENGGSAWKSIFDDNPTVNVGALAIDQRNPSTIWVGTGEGNPRNSMNLGLGIFKSVDSGITWKRAGLDNSKAIHRIIVDPVNSDVVYAGVMGDPFTPGKNRGLYKTIDGGKTWSLILSTNDQSGVADLVMDPFNPSKLFAALYEHHRAPYSFTSGGPGSALFVTMDGGKSWKKLGTENGLPAGELGRIGIAIARSNTNRVYAKVEAKRNALYRSNDGGLNWEMINDNPLFTNNRPFYFQDLAVDTKDENRLYNIYQPLTLSLDGGKSFIAEPMIPADETKGIHADFHAFWIHPDDPAFFIIGGDGGIGITHDKGVSWYFPESIPVGQFYHINVDNDRPYNVYGGLQDNGNWSGPGYVWRRGGIRTLYWQYLVGGDGFYISPDSTNSRYGYGTSQNGELYRYDKLTGYYLNIRPPAPDMKTRLRFNWNAGFAQDPTNSATAYYGSQFLHKTTDKGATWQIISPDLSTNNAQHQKQDYGGLTIDASGAEFYNSILSIAPSALDKKIIWIGTDDGNVQLTKDGGKTWSNLTANLKDLPKESWIAQIRASRFKPGEAFLVANDYRKGDYNPYIYRTRDFGVTWERIMDASDVKGYALTVIQDPVEPRLIFAGTENGLWISIDDGESWEQFKNGFPSVSTMDLAIQEPESALIVGTFGRSIWIIDDLLTLRKVAREGLQRELIAFPVGDAVQVKGLFINPPGNIWTGFHTTFEGENRVFRTTLIPFYLKSVKQGDVLTGKIYNSRKEIIRNLTSEKVEAGLNYLPWSLDETAASLSGSDEQEIKSLPVMPGSYSITLSYNGQSDSTAVNVIADPRYNYSYDVDESIYQARKRLNKVVSKMAVALDQIKAGNRQIDTLLLRSKDIKGSGVVALRKASLTMKDSLKSLREKAFGTRPAKQVGAWSSFQVTAVSKIGDASDKLRGRTYEPSAQDKVLIHEAEQLSEKFVKEVDVFFSKRWKPFQNRIEKSGFLNKK